MPRAPTSRQYDYTETPNPKFRDKLYNREPGFLLAVTRWLSIKTRCFPGSSCRSPGIMAVLPELTVPDKDSSRHMSWIRVLLHTRLDDDVCTQNYAGNGTNDDPYIVDYLQNDSQDAMNFSKGRKWAIAILQSLSTFAVTFASSFYVSGIKGVMQRFNVSSEVATLGLSLFVLGFALGPLIWAPLSESYGRKSVYVISYTAYTAFSVAAACAPNITALLILRFFASAFGSSSMTNTGGVIADMFSRAERGLATSLFVTAPFLGPAFGRCCMSFHAANRCLSRTFTTC